MSLFQSFCNGFDFLQPTRSAVEFLEPEKALAKYRTSMLSVGSLETVCTSNKDTSHCACQSDSQIALPHCHQGF